MYSCQQVLISKDSEVIPILEFICSEANKLSNCAIYYARQLWFKKNRFCSKYDLDLEMKSNIHFNALRSAVAQQTIHEVVESFTSYRKRLALYKKGELKDKPKPPKYKKKGGMNIVSYPARWLKLKDDRLVFSLGKQVKAWFGIDSFCLPMPSNLDFKLVKEVRILPRNGCFYAEFVSLAPQYVTQLDKSKFVSVDTGLNNWLTCVSNVGKSFIIDGRKVKSQNQWYNKQVAKLKKNKPQGFWDEQLADITEKRNRQMRDNINKAARFIINWCLNKNVGTVILGWNQRNKNGINIGKKNNQEFVHLPTAKLKNRIAQLCQQYGIEFVETEESYTSKSSFLSNDELPVFGAKSERVAFSGKRGQKVKGKLNNLGRGGYICPFGWVNSDLNGAANIARKVATQLGLNLAEVVRGVLTRPHRYSLDDLSKSYRKRSVESCLQTDS
ncbi:RNA-guided endonuclease InsQ/TnpB family protein [Merismopedia glauca]|uniref:Transposase n=1 Tax=Merismopedia glauca CCAP 1448/3 TaxID=1296344 RepID=A0A2T1BZU4_9CYAN|nr:RNA-guided endonuclease TnpB family protein [Merismopedia glauca]PSB01545.1 transposase [Merismopedia glauca CCAP 1448/3]